MLAGQLLAPEAPAAEPAATLLPSPTPLWLATQLVPSSTLTLGDHATYGLEWQVTPLLWAFGLDPRVSRWRVGIVEPLARVAGSAELAVSPGVLFADEPTGSLTVVLRTTLPLVARGEYWSVAVGAGYRQAGAAHAATVELGTAILFGMLGLRVAWSGPAAPLGAWTLSATFRYF